MERIELISVVTYAPDGTLGWRINPEEINYVFKRYGINNAKKLIIAELNKALIRAEAMHEKTIRA